MIPLIFHFCVLYLSGTGIGALLTVEPLAAIPAVLVTLYYAWWVVDTQVEYWVYRGRHRKARIG